MLLLSLGLVLWAAVHFWKRAGPEHRAGFGDKGKIVVAVGAILAIVLMVTGYKSAQGTVYWGRTAPMTGINNLLMVLAFYVFATSAAKTKLTKYIRHPQLTAVMLFAVAHLLVNGDTPSFVLFGGLFVWAAAEVVVINRANGPRGPYQAVPMKKEITAVIVTIVVVAVVAVIHKALGYNPFG
tara:strand:- start:72068 stop:72613 length:546 start_codon:yes stop_codon:yes gene_type:complete